MKLVTYEASLALRQGTTTGFHLNGRSPVSDSARLMFTFYRLHCASRGVLGRPRSMLSITLRGGKMYILDRSYRSPPRKLQGGTLLDRRPHGRSGSLASGFTRSSVSFNRRELCCSSIRLSAAGWNIRSSGPARFQNSIDRFETIAHRQQR